jgi:hypothetical protein
VLIAMMKKWVILLIKMLIRYLCCLLLWWRWCWCCKQTISNVENADYDDHDANYPNCDAN